MTGPAIVNIFAPTPKMKPSAAVNIGHSDLQKIFALKQQYGIMLENPYEVTKMNIHRKKRILFLAVIILIDLYILKCPLVLHQMEK